jgi:hypothetical protein
VPKATDLDPRDFDGIEALGERASSAGVWLEGFVEGARLALI